MRQASVHRLGKSECQIRTPLASYICGRSFDSGIRKSARCNGNANVGIGLSVTPQVAGRCRHSKIRARAMRASRLRLPESAATIGLGCRNVVDDLDLRRLSARPFRHLRAARYRAFRNRGPDAVTANQGYRIVSLFDRMHGCVERFFANAF